MTLARRSRSASACLAMARCIDRECPPVSFDLADLDAPGLGVLARMICNLALTFVALRKDFVELELADDAAKSGLRQLRVATDNSAH